MTQIIREGNVRTYVHICRKCGCKFLYNPDDIEFRDVCDSVKCPMPGCGYMDIVDKTPASAQDFKDLESKGWR